MPIPSFGEVVFNCKNRFLTSFKLGVNCNYWHTFSLFVLWYLCSDCCNWKLFWPLRETYFPTIKQLWTLCKIGSYLLPSSYIGSIEKENGEWKNLVSREWLIKEYLWSPFPLSLWRTSTWTPVASRWACSLRGGTLRAFGHDSLSKSFYGDWIFFSQWL